MFMTVTNYSQVQVSLVTFFLTRGFTMVIVNVQVLTDREYASAIPNGYVINVKDIQLTKVVVQLAKKTPEDNSRTTHINTDKFVAKHPDCIEGFLEWVLNEDNGHIELTVAIPPTKDAYTVLTPIFGRMRHRTLVLSNFMDGRIKKSGGNYRSKPSNVSNMKEEAEAEAVTKEEEATEGNEAEVPVDTEEAPAVESQKSAAAF